MADLKIKAGAGSTNKLLIQSQDQANNDYAIQVGDAGATTLTNATLSAGTIQGATAINTSGAITTTGAFTSKGIDDNASSTAMAIDSSGRITSATQPRFSAFHATNSSLSIGANNPFPFNDTKVNVGGHFDTSSSNYKFTAPVTGDYYLYFQSIFQGTSTNGYCTWMFSTGSHMGTATHFNEEFSNGSAWKQVILGGMYHMTVGCEVYLKVNTISVFHGGSYSMLCGWLVG